MSPSVCCKMPRCGKELGPGPYWEMFLGLPAAGGAGEGDRLTPGHTRELKERPTEEGVPTGEGGQLRDRKEAVIQIHRSAPWTWGPPHSPEGIWNLSSVLVWIPISIPKRAPSSPGLFYYIRILQPRVFKQRKGRSRAGRAHGRLNHGATEAGLEALGGEGCGSLQCPRGRMASRGHRAVKGTQKGASLAGESGRAPALPVPSFFHLAALVAAC